MTKKPKPEGISLSHYIRPGFEDEYKDLMNERRFYENIKDDPIAYAKLTKHQIDSLEEQQQLRDFFTNVVCSNAANNVTRQKANAVASSKGGQETAKTKAAGNQQRNERIKQEAEDMIKNGADKRYLTGILARKATRNKYHPLIFFSLTLKIDVSC